VLGEVQLPDLVRPRRILRERGLPTLGEFSTFPLIMSGQDQALVTEQAQYSRWLHQALGEAAVELRVWKKSAENRLGPWKTSR